MTKFNPLNAELNPICHLLALLGGATIVVVSRLRVKVAFPNFANAPKTAINRSGWFQFCAKQIPLANTVFLTKTKHTL